MKRAHQLCLFLAILVLTSCSGMSGTSSLTLITDQNEKMAKYYKPIGPEISGSECVFHILHFSFGIQPIHESLLAKMLEENKADVLLNADFSNTFFEVIVFGNHCVKITGTPARLRSGN